VLSASEDWLPCGVMDTLAWTMNGSLSPILFLFHPKIPLVRLPICKLSFPAFELRKVARRLSEMRVTLRSSLPSRSDLMTSSLLQLLYRFLFLCPGVGRADERCSATPIHDLRTEIGRPHGRILWGRDAKTATKLSHCGLMSRTHSTFISIFLYTFPYSLKA
jgi:hypothetical protein